MTIDRKVAGWPKALARASQ
jgi:hypothetical protein